MIARANFAIAPWSLRETELDLDVLAQAESIFALSNGHIGLRANLDEGEPFGLPGTYLNSFYELRPLPHAEIGYGDPESAQTIVNVTNGKIIRLLVDDEPLDVRYGQLLAHERELDLRAGVLRRRADWRSPAGTAVRISSTRLVSFVQRTAAAILYDVEPLAASVRVVVQSELVANEPVARAIHRPACRRGTRVAARLLGVLRSRPAGRARPFHPQQQARDGRRDGPSDRRAARDGQRRREPRRPRPGDGRGRPRARTATQDREAPRLRVVEPALAPGTPRRGRGRAGAGAAHRLGRAHCRTARVSRRLLGSRRRRDRRRHRAPAGAAVRAVPHASGRRTRRAAGHPREGIDRPRLRRAHVLGHRTLHPARPDVHGAGGRRRRPALAARDARPRPRAGSAARPRRRRLPVADDSRPGMLGVLACRNSCVPHRRRHRGRGRPLPDA